MFNVNKEKCIGCSQCVKDCPVSAISLNENKAEINNTTCFKCGHCIAICPVEAVSTDDYNMEEVIPYDKAKFTVDAENLLNFIKFRRSTRRFKNQKVEKEMCTFHPSFNYEDFIEGYKPSFKDSISQFSLTDGVFTFDYTTPEVPPGKKIHATLTIIMGENKKYNAMRVDIPLIIY